MLKRPQAARLLAVDREAQGTRLLLLKRDEAAIGKAEGAALRLSDPNVADRHAVVRYAHGRYYLVDLKSEPGTFINGKRIRRTQRLKHGDVLRFGNATPYRFIDPDSQKRRRWRRNLRASVVVVTLLAVGLVDHYEQWGLLRATYAEIVALGHSNVTAKPVAAPIAVAVSAPARPAAPSAAATGIPGPAAYAANVAPTARPLAASTPKPPESPPASRLSASSPMTWLERINFFRSGAGLDPIRDNTQLSAAAAAHANYLLVNFGDDIRSAKPMSGSAYEESPGKTGYTESGAREAPNLQLEWGCSTYDAAEQIDHWIAGPFHRLAMLDPYLAEAGYGEASGDGCWVAALRMPPPAEEVKRYPRAIEFPPDGAASALDWPGLEAPDPLASCPGYERPAGLPITLQLGRLVSTNPSAHSLTEDGKPIEHCVFDAPSYLNADSKAQEYGRWNLRNASAVVIVARAPLRPGSRYAASITANGVPYTWSFTVASNDATTFTAIAKFPTAVSVATPATKTARIALPHRTARPHRATPAPEAMASMTGAERYAAATAPSSLPTTDMTPPTTETSPAATNLNTNWLTIVNLYRSLLKLQPVEEDPALSRGCLNHARYLVTNYESKLASGWNPGSLMHTEDESKPGYTPDGIKAARASDVMFGPPGKYTDDQRMTRAIEAWMAGPFHRPSLVNPDLRQVGFGQYCGQRICAAALDWRSELEPALPGGHPYPKPIEVPPDGATVKPSGFGNEWPSAISACSGYPYNAPAITLQVGINMAARITDASLTQITGAAAGTKVGTCAYDLDKYTNPDPGTQAHGREVLKGFGEAVMMVRDPLIGGESYRVDMTVNGTPYTWTLTALK